MIENKVPGPESNFDDESGEFTIKLKVDNQNADLKLYSSWFCPYAQRVWIALEEKGINYQYNEINPYETESTTSGDQNSSSNYTKIALSLTEKRIRYPKFIESSPKGLVPAISYHNRDNIKVENGHENVNTSSIANVENVADSMVILEYLEDRFNNSNNNNTNKYKSLLPKDPANRAHARFWCVHINEHIIPHFYKMLMMSDAVDRELAKQNILCK